MINIHSPNKYYKNVIYQLLICSILRPLIHMLHLNCNDTGRTLTHNITRSRKTMYHLYALVFLRIYTFLQVLKRNSLALFAYHCRLNLK